MSTNLSGDICGICAAECHVRSANWAACLALRKLQPQEMLPAQAPEQREAKLYTPPIPQAPVKGMFRGFASQVCFGGLFRTPLAIN